MMASRFLTPLGTRGLFSRDPFLDLQREMNRLLDRSFRDFNETGEAGLMLSPRVDITQKDDGWEITAELPGVAKDDIDLRLDGDMLTICGEKRDERKDEKNRFVERSYGSFSRSIQLPFTPDASKVEADCEHGVLTIKLPKGVEQEKSKKIAIGGAAGRTIDARSEEPALGKDWLKKSELTEEQAEKGQGAPA
jgi:HSP20 family protein